MLCYKIHHVDKWLIRMYFSNITTRMNLHFRYLSPSREPPESYPNLKYRQTNITNNMSALIHKQQQLVSASHIYFAQG